MLRLLLAAASSSLAASTAEPAACTSSTCQDRELGTASLELLQHSLISEKQESPRFLILTDTFHKEPGYRAAYESKKCFAQKHGYSVQADHDWQSSMHFSKCGTAPNAGFWAKFVAVANAFAHSHAEWFVWMDSDVMVLQGSTKLEDFVDDTHHLVVADSGDNFNDGVFLIRNSDWGRNFMEDWNAASAETNCSIHDQVGFEMALIRNLAKDLGQTPPTFSSMVLDQIQIHGPIMDARVRWQPSLIAGWDRGPQQPISSANIRFTNGRTTPAGLNAGCGCPSLGISDFGVNAYQAGHTWIHFACEADKNGHLERIASASFCSAEAPDLSYRNICGGTT